MRCPYCGNEMTEGYMQNSREDFRWTPKGKRAKIFYNKVYPYEILLKKRSLISYTRIKVYRCGECRVEIINEKDLEVGD